MARARGSAITAASGVSTFALLFLLVSAPALAGEVRVQVVDGDGHPVENVAIVIRGLDGDVEHPEPGEAVVDQVDQEFVPPAIVIPVHTRVRFPNNDDIRHHVYSFSEAKSFELALYEGEPARPIAFPNPGIVAIGCNIHDWMRAHIYVVDSPWHGLTDGDGVFEMSGLPVGSYRVEAWHHGLVDERQAADEFALDAGVVAEVEVAVDIEAAPAPRRSPRDRRYR